MWSGPRNISTAMMRAWENRADTFVTDEPFYACYLNTTGIDHPGRPEILASQSTDWQEVANNCLQLTKSHQTIHYQKHMTQHMLPHLDLHWINHLHNVFLIRSPEEVVASYSQARPNMTPEDLGFEQQHRIFEHVCKNVDPKPLVISAKDVLKDPQQVLNAICEKCQIPFDQAMLNWPAGKRDSDGVWAPHWYNNVQKSTCFAPPRERNISLNTVQQEIANRCRPFFNALQESAAL